MLLVLATAVLAAEPSIDLDLDLDVDATLRIGETLRTEGRTRGDLYSIGGSLVVDAPVEGDVGGLAKDIRVEKTGSVGGDLTLAGDTLVLHGPVAGDVRGAMRVLDLNSRVRGSVEVAFHEVRIGRNARIDGDLDYTSEARIPALETIVEGAVTWQKGDVAISFD
jgi:cytoskeletal protein CcmA (bactofilin family)